MMRKSDQNQSTNLTIRDIFSQRVSSTADALALHYEVGGIWRSISWQEYGAQIDRFSRSLIALGVAPEDKIALIGHNTCDWFVADMAIMTTGLVTVPIYETSSREQIIYILQHSDAKILIMEDASYLERVLDVIDEVEGFQYLIVQSGHYDGEDGRVLTLSEFQKKSLEVTTEDLSLFCQVLTPETLATLIYTSGTTGPPKGVMLTHKNSVAAAINVDLFWAGQWDGHQKKSCSYLPLSHVAERVISLLAPLLDGRQIYLFPDMGKIMDNLKHACPTLWLGVPRVWEKMYEGVRDSRVKHSPLKKVLIDWALKTGLQYNTNSQHGKNNSFSTKLSHFIAKKLVIDKILKSLGLHEVVMSVTGGAPSRPEVADFFSSLGLWLLEVYGQTEGYGTTSMDANTHFKHGSCGKPFPLVDVKIADDGEILLKGDNVSPGYYKDAQLTAETFKDGWLNSGDLGRLDEEGYLWVTGRKKDIIITSGGKNISPQKIEHALSMMSIINYALLVGDGKKYLTALIDLNYEQTLSLFQEKLGNGNRDLSTDHPLLKEMLDDHISTVNGQFSRVEKVKKYIVLFDAISLENGLLTNTLKLKKNAVLERYRKEIETMY